VAVANVDARPSAETRSKSYLTCCNLSKLFVSVVAGRQINLLASTLLFLALDVCIRTFDKHMQWCERKEILASFSNQAETAANWS
jgi:hypothetical protein